MNDKKPNAHRKIIDICPNQIPMEKVQTLGEFIIEKQGEISFAKGELSRLLSAIRLAAKVVNREVNRAGLGNVLGAMGNENIQGEQQMKLDVFANTQFIASLRARGECCGIASEENDSYLAFDNDNSKDGKYVVLFDPLDGSSNIDVNVSIGTIFSIYKRKTKPGETVTLEDFLQPGTEQVAAGYVVYGSSTMLVYTTGNGVNGFTLDPSIGTFYLSHPNMRIPETGTIYSINEGNFPLFPDGIKKWIKYCHEEDKPTGRPYSTRYIGSLVSDFHRNLIKGGVYVYPQTSKSPNGKLRLLYECNPLAFIAEQAGGKASNGFKRIMEVESTELHQRVPLIIGSPKMVDKVCEFLQNPS